MPHFELRDASVVVPTTTGERRILEPTSLSITEARVALVGPNGSGKSTLARLLNGLVTATSGQVLLDGVDIATHGREVRRRVAFSFTDPAAQLVMPTVIEDVMLSLRRHERDKRVRRQRALDVLAAWGLSEVAEDSVHGLSGGQRQLLALAGVLATEPDVLVADEPTTLLDLRNARRITEILLDLPQQIVVATHDLALAAKCDRALLVRAGAVAADGPAAEIVAAYRSEP